MPDCSKSLLGGGQAFEEGSFLQSSQGMSSNSLHFSPEVVKALIGEPLTEEDLLKVSLPSRTSLNCVNTSDAVHCLQNYLLLS